MVAVAVVAVLAALLLPALGAGIQSSEAAQCSANLRTLAAGVLACAAENNGALPRSSHSAWAANEKAWSKAILPYLGEKPDPTNQEWAAIQKRRFRCPADKSRRSGQSYGLNVFFELKPDFDEYEGSPQQWRALPSIPAPTRTILLAEVGGNSDHVMAHFWEGEGSAGYDCAHDRHEGRANYAFADGHIELRRLVEIYAPSQSLNRWNPSLAGK